MKKTKLTINTLEHTIKFDVNSEEVLPSYLHYMLIHYKLPQDAIIIFNDKTVKLIKTKNNDYIYERIESNG